MKVLFLSYEVAPIYKFGGLGDIAAALPKALQKLGIDICIGMPVYANMSTPEFLPGTKIPMVYSRSKFYEKPGVVGVPSIKMHKAQAFAFFCKDILNVVKQRNFQPDIIHLNDWHTGLVPLLIQEKNDPFFAHTKSLLTIHNTRHQGKFPMNFLKNVTEIADVVAVLKRTRRISVNFLRRAIITSDWISTVSQHYAEEILHHQFGFGVGSYIIKKKKRFSGILNGIDYGIWNPETDPNIKKQFTFNTVSSAKKENKYAIQQEVGLPAEDNIPLFGMVARIAWQKGFDVLIPALKKILPKLPMQVIILGQEDPLISQELTDLAAQYKQKLVFINDYNEPLAHRIFAGSDFFLIPSIYEPCGLTQMISMKYGTIPLTSAVGGLKDTVIDGKTGYVFYGHNQRGLKTVIKQGLLLWEDAERLEQMRKAGMQQNFSSDQSASLYLQLYKKMVGSI